ncbi:nitrate/nitrite transporter NarK [Barrientosiimonas humi]|uniref:Lysosomal dipeptide transporter MFSD1 n=1 Tax=Barrientosiimonas humi TaxID=999931 RepID=A0A542X7X2_9MICO|nr:MFS transporter [Barrientosiimonas endolithica]TQL31921.1 nitrate/nitrite transporter NarK [Barrientosiimonas humi]CAG7571731.1 putative L-galactonate transporter [Barrientosiimonas humi]
MSAVTAESATTATDLDDGLRFRLGGRRAFAVWLTAIAIYVLAVFHRTSLGVAGIIAADRFGISSAQLATFAMVQLAVYAAMQIPVGALLDRFGSRVMLGAGLLTMSSAQLAFAFVESYAGGIVARIFVGMGDAMVFVSVLRLVALWFPPARVPMVTQVTGLLGQLGALVSAGPLAYALKELGWTTSFLAASVAGAVLAIALAVVVLDSPYREHERTELKMRAVGRAVRLAWRQPGTRLGLWCHFTTQFSSNVFAIMWGFPFLTAGQGLSTAQASTLLGLMVVTAICASPVFGVYITRYPYSRSTLVLGLVVAIMAVWGAVLLWPGRAPMWLLVLLVVITAAGGPGSMIGFDLARTFNPSNRIGSATGIVNVGGFAAALGTVVLIGVVLDHVAPGGPSTYTVDSFRWAMAVQYLVWVTGLVMIVRYRRRTRSVVHSDEAYAHLVPARLADRARP